MNFEVHNFKILSSSKYEVTHYYNSYSKDYIASNGNNFKACVDGTFYCFKVPLEKKYFFLKYFRLARRALRLDKSNACINYKRDGIIIVYRSRILFFEFASKKVKIVSTLQQCRNVLHQGIAVSKEGIYLGEYGANPKRNGVPVWKSEDDGRSWKVIYRFPPNTIKHIHGIYTDPYSNDLWIPTGDFENECFVFQVKNKNFRYLERHGDGSQCWRTVNIFFKPNQIIWAMDSQLETSFLQIFNRKTNELNKGQEFKGPIWFIKHFDDGSAVLQSTVEIGPGVKSNAAHLYFSKDLIDWREVASFKKDLWPMRYFKFGVIGFADGVQSPKDFVIFGEALKGVDGVSLRVCLN